jgi:hypothetical protein
MTRPQGEDAGLHRSGVHESRQCPSISTIRSTVTDVIPAIDPQRSALLVMDYQPAVLASLTEAEALLARLAEA